MRLPSILTPTLIMLLLPQLAHAVDCSPFRPDAPVAQSAETEIKAEVGGLLSKLVQAEGEYRVTDAQKALGANASDPDGLVKWQSKLYYFCEALNEDETISTRDRIEIMRGIMDASSDAQLNEAIKDDVKKSETTETEKQIDLYANHGLRGASRLTDNQGNSHIASKIEFGGKEMSDNIFTNLPPDVPMRGRLTFDNVSSRATGAALLEISGTLDGEEVPTFAIRDISFE